MKILIACSKYFYDRIPEIKEELIELGHEVSMPNSYDDPFKEERVKKKGLEDHIRWKSEMLKRDKPNLEPNDAILVLNFEKNGQLNYIGGATFLEIYKAWELNKKIYLYNTMPHNIFRDELTAMDPTIINRDLKLII